MIDTKPIPLVGYKRSKKRSAFGGSANYGFVPVMIFITLAQTVAGLASRIIMKVIAHLLRYLLRLHSHIDIQTFRSCSDFPT